MSSSDLYLTLFNEILRIENEPNEAVYFVKN